MGFRLGVFGALWVLVACGGGSIPARSGEEPPQHDGAPSGGEPGPRTFSTPCSREDYRQDGKLWHRQVFGSDGALREEVFFFPDGRQASRVLQQVEDGRVLWRETFSETRLTSREEWTYGDDGQVLRHEVTDHTSSPSRERRTDFFYDGRKQLREDHSYDGALERQTFYSHGEHGLVQVRTQDAHGPLVYSTQTFTYHPNGQVAREEWESEQFRHWREFDTEGREVVNGRTLDESSSRTEQGYDSKGRLVRRYSTGGGSSSVSVREETFAYEEGRLTVQRLSWDNENLYTGETLRVREERRYRYDVRGNLSRELCDTNEDGEADWRRTFTRDEAGNLLEERLEGQASPLELGRTVYSYECHD